MTILLQCGNCWLRFSTKHKKCPKCGFKIVPSVRRYALEVRDISGKKHVKALGNVTLEEAKDKEVEFKKDVRSEKPATQTVRSVCLAYVNKTRATQRVYASDVDHRLCKVCEYFGSEADVSKIDVTQVDSFRGHLLALGLSKSTVDRYSAAGRAAWNYSVMGDNPWKRAGLFNPDNKITRYFSDEERKRLLDACQKVNQQLYEIVYVALGTGLRKSEVLQLKRSQVDFDKGSLSVVTKGGKKRLLYPADSVIVILRGIQNNDTEYFWVDRNGKTHSKYWRYSWQKALVLAGLPRNTRFHDIRHDSATRAYSESGDIYLVQQMLGHSSISTTMRYAHLEKNRLQKVFNMIDPSQQNGTSIGNSHEKD